MKSECVLEYRWEFQLRKIGISFRCQFATAFKYNVGDMIIIITLYFRGFFANLHIEKMQNRIAPPLKLSLVAFEWTHSRAISGSRKIHFSPSFTGILRGWQLFKEIRKRRGERERERERTRKKSRARRENPGTHLNVRYPSPLIALW